MRRLHIVMPVALVASLGMLWPLLRHVRRSQPVPMKHAARNLDPTTSCGPVSLAVVSEYLGRPTPIAEFHVETGAGNLGFCSLADLKRALNGRGFAARAVRFDVANPPTHKLPMVLFVDGDHFLTAVPAREGGVVLIDPPLDPKRTAWAGLKGRWKGEALVVALSNQDVEAALSTP